jgi:hypothetical protein
MAPLRKHVAILWIGAWWTASLPSVRRLLLLSRFLSATQIRKPWLLLNLSEREIASTGWKWLSFGYGTSRKQGQRETPRDLGEILKTMDARLIEDGCLTLPLRCKHLDASALVADSAFAEPLRAGL